MSNFIKAWGSLVFGVSGADTAEAGGESATAVAKPPPGGTVLLIDDNQEFLDTTGELLRGAGFSVLTSNTGAKGLNMIRYAQEDLRLVLLDYTMPQLDGEQTLLYLRKLNPRVRVVGITGASANEVPAAYRENLDGLIFKPVRGEELLAKLGAVLQESSSRAAAAAPSA
jgi:two-component system, cell cycle sensor histidine kinase and response regulator CckA